MVSHSQRPPHRSTSQTQGKHPASHPASPGGIVYRSHNPQMQQAGLPKSGNLQKHPSQNAVTKPPSPDPRRTSAAFPQSGKSPDVITGQGHAQHHKPRDNNHSNPQQHNRNHSSHNNHHSSNALSHNHMKTAHLPAVSNSRSHNHVDLEQGHHHHHQHHHHHHGAGATVERQSEQEAEQCRVFCLQFFILCLYTIYMVVLVGPLLYPKLTGGGLTICIIFNVVFILMTISFWQCATMDPGEVPSIKGPAAKHAKFCVKCHNGKPDRTHHCSTCGRCVLNMDHHCPWLANCVGFHNRQFFILILFYGVISATILTTHAIVYMFTSAPYVWPKSVELEEIEGKTPGMLGFVLVCVMLFFSLVLLVALVTFLRFHLNLVFTNSTTIETQFNRASPETYTLGSYWLNCQQVFGKQWYLWWCPIWREPLGDGYVWGKQLLQQLEKAEGKESADNGAEMTRMMRRSVDYRHR